MKEIVNFIKWQWNRWETWKKWYIVMAFIFGAGVATSDPYKYYILAVPITALILWTGKWWIWDQVVDSWNSYKKEKQSLFETIREGKRQ